MIDILVPVLGRPQNAQPLVTSIHANTTIPVTVLFLTSPGDAAEFEACLRTGAHVLELRPGDGGEYACKINRGFRETISPFVLCAADDLQFEPGWDTTIIDLAARTGKGVIGTNDMANRHVMNGGFSTHPLVRRDYIEYQGGSLDGPGIVYHEGYDHNYVDRELAGVAQWRDQWVFAADSIVRHLHPGFRSPRADATYKKGMRRFREDHMLFMERSGGWDHHGLVAQEQQWLAREESRRQGTRRR